MTDRRGQLHVVGVALLLGIAVIAMGALTAAVGAVVNSTAAQADADRVADDLDTALQPVGATGPNRGQVTFASGRLHRVDRTLEVRDDGTTVETIRVDALVFEPGDRRVASLLGAVVRGQAGRAWLETKPPITADEDVLVVGAVSSTGGVTATVQTDIAHDRRPLGDATVTFALGTATPAAWERAFEAHGATVMTRHGTPPTVEATFPGERTGYLVVHDLEAEVTAYE